MARSAVHTGAVLAAALIIAVEQGLLKVAAPFRFAVLLSSGPPFDLVVL